MKVLFEPDDAKFIVLRMHPDMHRASMPMELEGQWRKKMPFEASYIDLGAAANWPGAATAWPTNSFEVRADGEIAQVYEVRW